MWEGLGNSDLVPGGLDEEKEKKAEFKHLIPSFIFKSTTLFFLALFLSVVALEMGG